MKYPKLVPDIVCKIPVKVVLLSKELNEDGEPTKINEIDTLCNYQSKCYKSFSDKKLNTVISTSIYFSDDIFPEYNDISDGYVFIFGDKREIEKGEKARNPDGTVNYTRLELK